LGFIAFHQVGEPLFLSEGIVQEGFSFPTPYFPVQLPLASFNPASSNAIGVI
jgi:hypothetical protein